MDSLGSQISFYRQNQNMTQEELTPLFMQDTAQNYIAQFSECRLRLAKHGILMPVVRLRDVSSIAPNEFQILSYHRILYCERVAQPDENSISHMAEKLYNTVSAHYDMILNHDLVRQITENLSTEYPALISGVVPEKLSYRLLYQLLKKLWKNGNCFLYLINIIEHAEDLLAQTPDMTPDELADQIRKELADLQTPLC